MDRVGRRIAVTLIGLGALSVVALLGFVVHTGDASPLVPSALPGAFLVAGAIGARARPDHRGLQLLLAVGTGHLAAFAMAAWLGVTRPQGWGPWLAALVSDGLYLAGFLALALLVATYPTGRLESRGLRWFAVVSAAAATSALLVEALLHPRLGLAVDTGLATVPAPPPLPLADVGLSFVGAVPALVVVGVVILVVRARRFTGDERGALGWASLAGGVMALMLAATPLAAAVLPDVVWAVAFVTIVSAVPFVLLGGLVRYRLLQVDLYLVRTLGRGVVALVVLAAYAGATALLGEAGFVTAAVVLTVLAALTGGRLLRRVEAQADRWLAGGRVARRGLLDLLVAALPVADGTELADRICRMVTEGLDVAWTRVVVHGEVSSGGDGVAEVVVPLLVGTTDVGALECGPRRGGWGRSELARLESLAVPVALALHERELTRELAERVDELTASRARLVQVEQAVRRQVERDLHDGAQQLLVALLARLAVARASVTDPPTAAALETAHELAGRCLRDLRALVAGLHPALLGDKGLRAAVGARADLLPIRVTVDADPRVADGRFPDEIESAAYFVVCEALANVLKHSGSDTARVVLSPMPPHGLRVAVTDEGSGTVDLAGGGLAGLRDRVDALGGNFQVVAVPDVGTTVVAEFPVDRAAVLHG